VAPSVSIDPDYCVGSGDCVRLVPEAFELREEIGVSVPRPAAAETPVDLLVEAARNCPTQAIRVVADDGSVLHESNG
jgi:ferredoxin